MKVLAVLPIFVGATMYLAANTRGDSVVGVLMVIAGLLIIFWPTPHPRS